MAPFLAFLDDQRVAAHNDKPRPCFFRNDYKEEFKDVTKAHLIFTSRDSDTYSWLSPYIDSIMENTKFEKKISLYVFLTGTNFNTLPSFLFWRAFLLRQEMVGQKLINSPTNIRRPNFLELFSDISSADPGDYYVYVCAGDAIIKQVRAV